MKKKLLLSIMLLLFLSNNYAQEKKSYWGITGGMNISNALSKNNNGDKSFENSRTGFYIGFLKETRYSDKFAIQTELIFSQQGLTDNAYNGGISLKGKIMSNAINVPLTFKFYLAKGLALGVGPQVGFLLKPKIKLSSLVSEGISRDVNIDFKNDWYNKIDFAICAGLSYDFSKNVGILARYNLGLSNAFSIDNLGDTVKSKNRVYQFGLYFKF